MTQGWGKDLFAERTQKAFGLPLRVEPIRLNAVDWALSRANCARLEQPMNEDVVEQYALAMERGDEFPMAVVRRVGKSYVILGGNHRLGAAELRGLAEVPAYVVETDDEYVISMLPRVLNMGIGVGTPRAEAIKHAVFAVSHHNLSVKDAASLFCVKPAVLSDHLRAFRVGEKLATLGVPGASRMPLTVLQGLGKLEANENVLVNAARLVAEARLSKSQVDELVVDVRKGKTESAQIAAVEARRRDLLADRPQPLLRQRKNVRTKWLGALTTLERYLAEFPSWAKMQITEPEEKKRVQGRLKAVVTKIQKLLGAAGR